MAYSGNLLTVSSDNLAGLKQYKVTYAKLWRDSDRNMNGDVTATLIGIFPKLELEFGGILDENRVSNIISKFSPAYFPVTYFDPKSKTTKTGQFYASDFGVDMMDKARGLYKPFTVNLIPVSKQA